MPTKKNTPEEPTLASLTGEGFAFVQHAIDKGIEWGFHKMKEQSKETKADRDIQNPYLKTAASAGRSVLRFFGSAGSAYYKKYEDLKKRS